MGESIKAVLQAVLWMGAAAFVAFLLAGPQGRRAAHIPLVPAAVAGAVLFWNSRRPDRSPDLLKNTFGDYFEKDGLAFSPRLEVGPDGALSIGLYYQNQWERGCQGAVVLQSRTPRVEKGKPIEFAFKVDAEGGEVGVYSVPWTPPSEWGGTAVLFAIGAQRWYPNGKGRIVRRSTGRSVGDIDGVFEKVATAVALLSGHIHVHMPASTTFRLPATWSAVAEPREPTKQVISRYDRSITSEDPR